MGLSLKTKITAGFAVALLILGVVGLLSYRSTRGLLATVDEERAAHQVIAALQEIQADLFAAEGAHRGYIITHDPAHLPRYNVSLRDVEDGLTELDGLASHYPQEHDLFERFKALVADRVNKLHQRLDIYESGGIAAVAPLYRGDPEDKSIKAVSNVLEGRVRAQLGRHEQRGANLASATLTVISLGSLLALLFLAFATAITRREVGQKQQALQDVEDREHRYKDLVESASELIQQLTPDGRFLNVNHAWLSTMHYREDQLRDMDILDVIDQKDHGAWCGAVEWAVAGTPVRELRVDYRRRDGSMVHLVGGLSCLFDNGQPTAIRGIFRDITEAERAEAELREQEHRSRQFLEEIPLGIFVANADGTTAYANHAARRIFGRGIVPDARPDELSEIYSVYCAGRDELYPTERLPIVRALGGEHVIVEDIEIARPDARIPLQVTAGPIHASDGGITGAIAIFSDISERRAVERLKDELISVVSHELRTPLTSIRGALGLVGSGRLGTLTDQGRKMIDIATTDTDRLVRLINDMLDIERMQSGRVEMHRDTCDAAQMVQQATEAMRPLAGKANVTIETDVPHISIWCDSDRVIQAITNLVGNAIKFSPADGTVRVAVKQLETEVEFRICDQGRGIPKGKLESIFERFQQVDATDAREKGGAGLGLAISKSIVVQHGGRIWAESDGQTGSSFVFTLPRSAASVAAEQPNRDEGLLLIAEDDHSAAEVLKTMLQATGFAVAMAGTGRDAIDMATKLKPRAIMLDIVMPGLNGWDALAAMKANPATRDIPVIVISALTNEIKHRDDRVAAWVAKPFSERELVFALRTALGDTQPTILIVEDDENLAAVLSEQFASDDTRTIHARNGAEAIRMAQSTPPDLLVLDLMLPGRDGFEVVDWLRQHEQLRRLPVIVYTALELDAAQKQQLTLGPSIFMTKSREEPEAVAKRVAELLERVKRDGNGDG